MEGISVLFILIVYIHMTVISAEGISERLSVLDSRSVWFMVYDGNNISRVC